MSDEELAKVSETLNEYADRHKLSWPRNAATRPTQYRLVFLLESLTSALEIAHAEVQDNLDAIYLAGKRDGHAEGRAAGLEEAVRIVSTMADAHRDWSGNLGPFLDEAADAIRAAITSPAPEPPAAQPQTPPRQSDASNTPSAPSPTGAG